MDLSGINASAFNDYYSSQITNAASDKLKSTLESAAENAKKTKGTGNEEVDRELMNACNQFEAYFLEQIFKEMQKSVDALRTDQSSSNKQLVDYFKDQTLQDLTKKSTETQGLGFAQMLYENMKNNVLASKELPPMKDFLTEEEASEQSKTDEGE